MSKLKKDGREPMPDKPEREVNKENYLTRMCAKNGWDCWKLTVPGRRGVPDRLILADMGIVVFCEVKATNGKVSALQARTIRRLDSKGFPAFIVSEREEIDQLINWINNAIRAKTVSTASD